MKLKRPKLAPLAVALTVLAVICGIRALQLDFTERLEAMTYDLRMRVASHFPAPTSTNFAFVEIKESGIRAVKSGDLGYSFGLLWPRQVYGRLVDELSAQKADVVGFDILFPELRRDQAPVLLDDGTGTNTMDSDEFFAEQMRAAGNVVLAVTPEIYPPRLFATNALALGGITADSDPDGVLRRVRAFRDIRHWHPLIEDYCEKHGIDLASVILEKDKIVLPQSDGRTMEIPLDHNGEMFLRAKKINVKPFTTERIWHMGIVLAAHELGLNLTNAIVDLAGGRITLRGEHQLERIIPVDHDGFLFVDWRLTYADPRLLKVPVETLLWQDYYRLRGETNALNDELRGKVVFIGLALQGNNLTDRGSTPLEHDTLLVSKHWNVANSIITGRFIRPATLNETFAIIIGLGLLTALLTWQLRALYASIATLVLLTGYTVVSFAAFVHYSVWLPLVTPVIGAILVEHISLVTYRVVFEEREQRRVKHIFSKIVAPEIVNELLQADKLRLGGAHREVTVFFADVRGFTTLTDQMQESVTEFIRVNHMTGGSGEKLFEESARETLETVNQYLALVAEAIKRHGGTLDKYIGDCVMAFWNAPVADERHALNCVLAAIDAQQAIARLNEQRLAQNVQREFENSGRAAAGLPPKPMLAALQLGTGINTGFVTTGLMGSEEHGFNYTVFGREVNLASRLEGVSGSGRIIISDKTHEHLKRLAPELAARCAELEPVTVKGIKHAVRIYEVPWNSNLKRAT